LAKELEIFIIACSRSESLWRAVVDVHNGSVVELEARRVEERTLYISQSLPGSAVGGVN
jgi:hypothetical protein